MRPLVGVVHLEPLPGSPRSRLPVERILELARRDGAAWARGGATALLVENHGDAPFAKDDAGPAAIAALAVVAAELRRRIDLPLGVNVLRNDARGALAVAAAAGAGFIRVNVLTGAMETDQGIVEGRAHDVLRYRAALGARVEIWADVYVKHAAPLRRGTPAQDAMDAAGRGGADVLLVTGEGTGRAADPARLAAVKRAVPRVPVYVASGMTPANAAAFRLADGFVVGTWAKVRGRVDARRVRELARALR